MNMSEMLFIGFLGLVFLGPKKLSQLAPRAGKALAHLRRTTSEFKSQLEGALENSEHRDPEPGDGVEPVLIPDSPVPEPSVDVAPADEPRSANHILAPAADTAT